MIIDTRQIDDIKIKFTELGQAVYDLSTENEEFFEDTLESLQEFKYVVSGGISEKTIEKVRDTIEVVENQQDKILGLFTDFSHKSGSSLMLFNKVLEDAQNKFIDLSHLSTEAVSKGEDLKNRAVFSFPIPKIKKPDKDNNISKGPPSLAMKEAKSLKSTITGMLRRIHVPLPGAILAGGVMWMAFGFQRRDRIRAEAGEVTNIIETAYDNAVRGMVRKGTNYISGIQESLQRYYGIARSEVQSVAKAFIDGGVKIEEMLGGVDNKIGMVGRTFMEFTLGLDKMFELAGGDSARRTVSYMTDYGKSIKEAQESTLKLMMAGKESGIGTMAFVNNVENAAGSLKQYGYDIDDVINMSITLQERFERMGVPKQFAGRQAALGLSQMASTIVSMSNEWKMMIGEEMGYGKGIDAIQKMQEAFSRVATGGKKDELFNLIDKLGKIVNKAAQGDETLAKYILKEASGLNLGVEGSNAVMMVNKALEEGDLKRAEEVVGKNLKTLQKSFLTERQKQSRFQRNMNEWMDGISRVGEGMLGMVGNILATMVAFFKSVPQLIINLVSGDDKANKILMERIGSFTSGMDSSLSQMSAGFKTMASAAKKTGRTILGSTVKDLERAIKFDPLGIQKATVDNINKFPSVFTDTVSKFKPATVETGIAPSIFTGTADVATAIAGFKPVEAPGVDTFGKVEIAPVMRQFPTPVGTQQVRIITVPVNVPVPIEGGGGTYQMPITEAYARTPEGDVRLDEDEWVGGGLAVVTGATDQLGNITMSLVGNCPQCGLIYGDESIMGESQVGLPAYSMRDEETLARMIRSEVGKARYTGSKEKEAVGIAYTALNRMRAGGRHRGKSLHEIITGGAGYGVQGSEREYSTAREATMGSRKLARRILEGKYADPTGGATSFFHSTGGAGYGSKRDPTKRTALPAFTKGLINTLNINQASFYGRPGRITKRAPDAEKIRQREIAKFEKRMGKPTVTTSTDLNQESSEDWWEDPSKWE